MVAATCVRRARRASGDVSGLWRQLVDDEASPTRLAGEPG